MNKINGKKSNKGFTLVELIVVLVILAVLAAILSPALIGYIDQARAKRYLGNAKTCMDAAQAMFTYQYAVNGGQVPANQPVVPGAIYHSGENKSCNYDQDISNTDFAKEVIKLAGLPEGAPYLFMVAVGSNSDKKAPADSFSVSETDKYTVYYAVYIESANAKAWYYYNGEWTTTNPRAKDTTFVFNDFNIVQSGPLKGMRLQYYLIAYDKEVVKKYPKTIENSKFWDWLKEMK